ncbi:19838_t:CDS:1 [Racocetra fulgida]|uniref:19838_t:CDS:1 n=1 Tax=Racocetra fulgida TaxID=60492 RepID=A0A9N9FBN9_9GLOM|nr:19838_t:CDS:1 [Racocetra fulgida]
MSQPISQQQISQQQISQQCMRISALYKPTNPAMEVDAFKLTLPTPLTSPNPGPTIPRVQSFHGYPSTPSSPTPITPIQLDEQSSYMKTLATSGTVTPLSLSERRERNKVASAKYRAKKHKQNQEMSSQINELIAENNVLTRQLEEMRAENNELKDLVDKLKSKLVEGKILKRLGRGAKLTAAVTNTIGTTTEGLASLSTTVRKGTRRNGYSGHAKGTEATAKNSRK